MSFHASSGLYRGQLTVGHRMVKHERDGVIGFEKRRIVKEVYAQTADEAWAKLALLRRDRELGVAMNAQTRRSQTLAGLFEDWLKDCEVRGRKVKTLWTYRQMAERYIIPTLGHLPIGELTESHVRRWMHGLHERGLGPTTIRNTRAVFHAALELAVTERAFDRNPVSAIKPPAMKRVETRFPTPDELRTLLRVAKRRGDRFYALWLTAAHAGCRPGELLGLGWDDIDWRTGRMTIRRNLVKVPGRPVFLDEPKNRRWRVFTLGQDALEALDELHREHHANLKAVGDAYGIFADVHLVFATHGGRPLLPRNVDRQFKIALGHANLPLSIRFYDMRHGNATMMLQAGIQPKVAAERLGHASTQLFNDRYAHLLEEMDAGAASQVQRVLRSHSRPRRLPTALRAKGLPTSLPTEGVGKNGKGQ